MNEYINITKENINSEHLCCAIADVKHKEGVKSKKDWLLNRIDEGHIFRKLNANGKIFIEYAPLKTAWVPIEATNYLYIYCLWVAGSYKGKGYAHELLNYAINEAKNKNYNGLCVISSKKKKPFLSEKGFFEKYGFKVVDSLNDFELLALSFNEDDIPHFTTNAKKLTIDNRTPTIYYSPQCPYTNNCINEITEYCKEINQKINIVKINSSNEAKTLPCLFNNWAIFINGKYMSNVLLNKNSFEKLLKEVSNE